MVCCSRLKVFFFFFGVFSFVGTQSKSTSDGLTDRCTELCSDMNTKRIVKMDKYMKVK